MEELLHIGYDLVINEIPKQSRVLDLGCGDGVLLERLRDEKDAQASGVEISEVGVSKCVEKGLYCYQGDIDEGLSDYRDNSFDYVILNQTIQSTKRPDYVISETMRISKNAIISFPNFGYLKTRMQLLISGVMPKNLLLPYEWYETPNIHLLTIRDFQIYCRQNSFPIKKECHFSLSPKYHQCRRVYLPNIFAQYGFFVLNGELYTNRLNELQHSNPST